MSDCAWEFSDNPDDPCSLCVVWVEGDDQWDTDAALPMLPSGTVAPYVYRNLHSSCYESAVAYSVEAAMTQ